MYSRFKIKLLCHWKTCTNNKLFLQCKYILRHKQNFPGNADEYYQLYSMGSIHYSTVLSHLGADNLGCVYHCMFFVKRIRKSINKTRLPAKAFVYSSSSCTMSTVGKIHHISCIEICIAFLSTTQKKKWPCTWTALLVYGQIDSSWNINLVFFNVCYMPHSNLRV